FPYTTLFRSLRRPRGEIVHEILLLAAVPPDVDSGHSNRAVVADESRHQPRMRAAAAARTHEMVDGQSHLEGLRDQFAGARDVPQRTERDRSSDRYDVRLPSFGCSLARGLMQRSVHIRPAVDDADRLDTEEVIEKIVAARLRIVAACDALL